MQTNRDIEMEQEILELTKKLVSIPSISDTGSEDEAGVWIASWLKELPYFREHPELTGAYAIPDDFRMRHAVYALVPGDNKKTLILTGHFDVVAVADYGTGRELAFDPDHLSDYLAGCELDEESRRDLESGEWMFGRGCCDMKGGLSAAMAFLHRYSEQEKKPGTLLFLTVPDEESYSAGMRGAVGLLKQLQDKYGLSYELLVDAEPDFHDADGQQIVPIGSAGKCMPVVLVQGEKAHVCKCFDGLNPMGIMGEIFSATELSLDFTDSSDGEITVPPTWLWMKDMKEEYDVSVPLRVSGYINMISFTSTPEDIMNRLVAVSRDAFERYVEKMKRIYTEYQKRCKYPPQHEISYEARVLTLQELCGRLERERGAEYREFLDGLYREISGQLKSGELNYPQATIRMMDKILTFSGITQPLVLLGFAPPYYPAVCSSQVKGKEKTAMRCIHAADEALQQSFGVSLVTENYTLGLSDVSYIAEGTPFDPVSYSKNTPLWGSLYQIDFDAIRQINMPGLILGPWGKDFHKMTERVNIRSLTREYPCVLEAVSREVWD